MNCITKILKALREHGVDVLLLGVLEKLLQELITLLTAHLTAVSRKKLFREEKRKQKLGVAQGVCSPQTEQTCQE